MQGIAGLLPIILLFVIAYVFIIRPQQKRMAEHAQLVRSIQVGDEVVTSGGIFGRVTRLTDERAELELSGGARLELLRSSILKKVVDEPAAIEDSEDDGADGSDDDAGADGKGDGSGNGDDSLE